ncbi:alkaline phosphatase family protein [Natrinema saccharevitans]|uniref:hypothetical protein n=1 Tax=Natrinema saccharevitans TaxID=301967 RepID=UPI00096D12EB|nr:hypothetical protein [Natrinema saccharevitans]
MYSLSQLRRGLSNPNLFFRELNRLYHRRLNTRSYNTSGVDIFKEDWDNLLILDACRYDMFEEHADLPGQFESRQSRSSSTREFLKANFQGRDLLDTVYVTANPQLYRHRDWLDVQFHEVRHIWQQEGWDDKYQTVMPETTTEHAIEAAAEHPDKRLIVHYIQPHYPFLIDEEVGFDNSQLFLKPDEAASWDEVMKGILEVDRSSLWEAYITTLKRALPSVKDLINNIEGKSVITSDHGNMVGERASPFPIREWGHPRGIYTKELVKVPWLVVDGERREILVEEQVETESKIADDIVEERLKDLGYK